MLAPLHLVRQCESYHLQCEQDQPMRFIIVKSSWGASPLWLVLMHVSNYLHSQWKLYLGKHCSFASEQLAWNTKIKTKVKLILAEFYCCIYKTKSSYYWYSFINSSIFIILTALNFRNIMNLQGVRLYLKKNSLCIPCIVLC